MRLKAAHRGGGDHAARVLARESVATVAGPAPRAGAASLLALQRTIGNRATAQFIRVFRDAHGGAIPAGEPTRRHDGGLAAQADQPGGGGRPLDPGVRSLMESRFGQDFGAVRVHTDAQAARMAERLGALAYTVGRDVCFAAGQYRPTTDHGKRLLAHELTHIVQQAGAAGSTRPGLSPGHHPAEREADRAADVVSGGAVASLEPTPPGDHYEVEAERTAEAVMRAGRPQVSHRDARGLVQRKLIVTGKRPAVDSLLGLLGPPSGFTLAHEAKTGEVSVSRSVFTPPSFVLASQLLTIIEDPVQNAEVHVGPGHPAMRFGEFPDLDVSMVQKLDIDELLRLEQGAPGSGVAFAIHEIVENYVAHGREARDLLKEFGKGAVFDLAHEQALDVERLVAGELVESGRTRRFGQRGADFPVQIDSRTIRWIADYENYFLVWDAVKDPRTGKSVVSNARQTPRVNVSTRMLDGFAPGSDGLPAGAAATIAAVVTDLKATANQFATARIDGFAAARGDPDPRGDLSRRRALEVADAIIQANVWGAWRRFTLVGNGATNFVAPNDTEVNRSRNRRVVITVDRPFLP